MEHVLIVTGGHLNMEFATDYLKTLSYDRVFAVDKGLEYVDALGIVPDYLVGDFDTVDRRLLEQYEIRIAKNEIPTVIERHPAKKDASDTELALNQAIINGTNQVTLLGGTGCRLDHVFANVGLLLKAQQHGIKLCIVDDTNRIRLLSDEGYKELILQRDCQHGNYISLIPLTKQVEGVTIQGVMYPLFESTIQMGSSFTVSNQIVEEKMFVKLEKGKMLLIESCDSYMPMFENGFVRNK